jgi:hypothetical protein
MKINIKSPKKGTIVLVSYDNKGQIVMKEMSELRYFFFKAEKNKNTKHKVLFTVLPIFFLGMFADDIIRGAKKFPVKFMHAFEVSRACDSNVSACQWNSKKETI